MVELIGIWADRKLPDGRDLVGKWYWGADMTDTGGVVQFEYVQVELSDPKTDKYWFLTDDYTRYRPEPHISNPDMARIRRKFGTQFENFYRDYVAGKEIHDIFRKPLPVLVAPQSGKGRGWHGEPGRHSRAAKKGRRK